MNECTLILITNIEFDLLYGATRSRVLCYARALSLKGIRILITSVYYPFNIDEEPNLYEGSIYFLGSKKKSSNYSKKTLPVIKDLNFVSILRYLRLLNSRFRKQEKLTYLLYPSNFALSILTSIYLRLLKGNQVFIEKNELHLGIALNMPAPVGLKKLIFLPALFFQLILSVLTDFIEIFFDGMICISIRLNTLYSKAYKKIILIPIITDTRNIGSERMAEKESKIFKIGYTGTISEKRDGIFTLIEAISLIKDNNQIIECNLYGSMTDSTLKKFDQIINKLKLEEIIHFYGNHDFIQIKRIQTQQNLLVLPRPSNLQTNFGFSTKLAEYLSSGVTVLSTSHSDVSKYIIDGENGFIVEELNPKNLGKKILEILNMKDQLGIIGERGRETALNHFNLFNYSERLSGFLFSD